jgi:hypothetical protein
MRLRPDSKAGVRWQTIRFHGEKKEEEEPIAKLKAVDGTVRSH